MSAFGLHVRSSAARYAFLPLLVVGIVVLATGPRYWVGVWPETGAAVTVSAFLTSLLVAGAAAWTAARLNRLRLRGLAEAAFVRPAAAEGQLWLAALLWLVVPTVLVAAIAFATTARNGSPPGLPAFGGYFLLAMVLVTLAAVWGWLIGRVLDPAVAALVAALSWFLAVSVGGQTTDATPVSGPPWLALQSDALLLRGAATALAVVAVCLVRRRGSRQTDPGRNVMILLAVAVMVGAAHLAVPVLAPRPPVAAPTCLDGQIRYCVWPEHEKYLPLLREVDQEVAALPLPLPLPATVVDYALSGSFVMMDGIYTELPGDFPPEFDISEGSRSALATGIATAITSEALPACPGSLDDPERRSDQLQAWLEIRLAGGGTPDDSTNVPPGTEQAWSEARRVAADPDEQAQAGWAAELIRSRQSEVCGDA